MSKARTGKVSSVVVIFDASYTDYICCHINPICVCPIHGRRLDGEERQEVGRAEQHVTCKLRGIISHEPPICSTAGKVHFPSFLAKDRSTAFSFSVSAVKYVATCPRLLWYPAGHTQVCSEAFVFWK